MTMTDEWQWELHLDPKKKTAKISENPDTWALTLNIVTYRFRATEWKISKIIIPAALSQSIHAKTSNSV